MRRRGGVQVRRRQAQRGRSPSPTMSFPRRAGNPPSTAPCPHQRRRKAPPPERTGNPTPKQLLVGPTIAKRHRQIITSKRASIPTPTAPHGRCRLAGLPSPPCHRHTKFAGATLGAIPDRRLPSKPFSCSVLTLYDNGAYAFCPPLQCSEAVQRCSPVMLFSRIEVSLVHVSPDSGCE